MKYTPAVMTEDGDTPTQKQIRDWAETYVEPDSAKAFARHVWNEWDEYEHKGEAFLRDLMRQWRGEDGDYPSTPKP